MLFRNIDTTPFQPEWNELLWARPIPSSLSIIYLGVSKNAISKMGMIGTIFLYNTQHAYAEGTHSWKTWDRSWHTIWNWKR